jgi:hypothetical protein
LHVELTLSILQDILAVHVTTARNVILRSDLRSNQTITNSWMSVLMTFCTLLICSSNHRFWYCRFPKWISKTKIRTG